MASPTSGPRTAFTFNLLAGFRYLDLAENLTIDQALVDPVNAIYDSIHDQFGTRNQFYGGQIGSHVEMQFGRLGLDVVGKLALGTSHQGVDVSGFTTETGPGSANPGTFPGGVLTQPTNIGQQTRNQFTVVPEVQCKIRFQILPNLSAFSGYDFLYWNQVVRPGSQIDHMINPTQTLGGTLVGPAEPAPQFNRTDFWAQGVTFGLELRF